MEKNLILYLILFIYFFNYKYEFFSKKSGPSIGSCWLDSTGTSVDLIGDSSPKWLKRVKKLRNQSISAKRCNKYNI